MENVITLLNLSGNCKAKYSLLKIHSSLWIYYFHSFAIGFHLRDFLWIYCCFLWGLAFSIATFSVLYLVLVILIVLYKLVLIALYTLVLYSVSFGTLWESWIVHKFHSDQGSFLYYFFSTTLSFPLLFSLYFSLLSIKCGPLSFLCFKSSLFSYLFLIGDVRKYSLSWRSLIWFFWLLPFRYTVLLFFNFFYFIWNF